MEPFGKYHGADWIGMTGNVIGLWYLSTHRKRGFLIGSVGCLGWLVFGLVTGSIPSIVANMVYIALNVRGWVQWEKHQQGQAADRNN